ncbi:MAG: FimV/HubP family polar landmark protein [Gammaproteobacteria bacterium]
MKIKKISLFLFCISFSSLLSSEITFLSTKTLQDEKAIQVVITINSTEEIDKSDISIYEYQTASSIKDLLFNLSLNRENISQYNLSFEKLKDSDSPYVLFTIEIKESRKDFFIFLSDDSYTSVLQDEAAEDASFQIIEEEETSNELIILADEITTVWSMAESLNYEDLSIYQVMWSIFETNRTAFIDDNINLIRNDMDILVPELQSIREIDKSYAKFSIREMIDANTFETEQMLTLVAPEPEEIIEKGIEVNQEKKIKDFDIQNQEQATLNPQAIIESQTRIIEIERNEEIDISNEEINTGASILQLLMVSLLSLLAGFLIAIFLIRRNSVTAKTELKKDDAVSSMPRGLSIKNDPFIQQFDLAISLYEMKEYEKTKTLLDEIIDKAKNQKLIQQAVDLRSKI